MHLLHPARRMEPNHRSDRPSPTIHSLGIPPRRERARSTAIGHLGEPCTRRAPHDLRSRGTFQRCIGADAAAQFWRNNKGNVRLAFSRVPFGSPRLKASTPLFLRINRVFILQKVWLTPLPPQSSIPCWPVSFFRTPDPGFSTSNQKKATGKKPPARIVPK